MKFNQNLDESIKQQIRLLLGREYLRMAPTDLLRTVKTLVPQANRQRIKATIQRLLEIGELTYSHHFSLSQLELNSAGLIKISERLMLTSDHRQGKPPCNGMVKMVDGCAFGKGDHPTTLLALKALDRISMALSNRKKGQKTNCLDIGTGTGILAIAAVILGITRAIGLDIDRLACHEAVKNVCLNQLSGKVHIVAGGLDTLKPAFYDLITANLRPPTLARLMPEMAKSTSNHGYWILSGFRFEEMKVLQTELPEGFKSIWQACDRNWAAFAAQKS